ncbi:long-chain-fatty-acid--CoA ligase 1-like isoform X2 [Tubulanus polymorphus]|uniref:long-chain-fatty-acid--CoA ligase 1-like isoform X2 n=1 Tax=Tubulanus polymorphus TaxID=672921 RepID=UPI003DA4E559
MDQDYMMDMLSNIDRSTAIRVGVAAAATTTAVVAAGYLLSDPAPIVPPVDLNCQSVEIEPGVRACPLTKEKIIDYLYEDAQTMYEGFQRGLRLSKGGPCLGTRSQEGGPYEWKTYEDVSEQAHAFGSALVNMGLEPNSNTFIGIYAQNCPEWVIVAEGCNMFSMVTVPLYDTYGPEACSYIINHTEVSTVICDRAEKAQHLITTADKTRCLKRIIVIENVTNNNIQAAEEHHIEVVSLSELQEAGRKNLRDHVPPKPDDLAVICYTSGTTGNPKGVMLSHKNVVADVSATFMLSGTVFEANPEQIHISYLPLAHMLERCVHAFLLMNGCRIGFFRGDVRKLMDDIKELKPTLFVTVPRLLNRMYDTINTKVLTTWYKRALFNVALKRKEAALRRGIIRNDTIWDKLVFGKIQAGLGGRVQLVITGSAPLSEKVLNFCRCSFGCPVIEGYGQTEASAGVTINAPGDCVLGQVGCPIPCNHLKLVDVPEMDYYATDGKGEVCVRGSNCFRGYFKDEAKTAETIDADNWVHTGDVGMWLSNGTLKIIDRKKHIFKLAQGEYIAPEKIENVYVRSKFAAQVFVDGNSLQPFIVCIIVPNEHYLEDWAKKQGIEGNLASLCECAKVKEAVLKDITDLGKKSGLKSFEQVRALHLCAEPFSVENGLMTPTMKSKRPALRKHFHDQIERLYTTSA